MGYLHDKEALGGVDSGRSGGDGGNDIAGGGGDDGGGKGGGGSDGRDYDYY